MNPDYDVSKPHHIPEGFRNTAVDQPPADLAIARDKAGGGIGEFLTLRHG